MATYRDLRAAGVTTRAAAALTGLSRATAARKLVTPLRATRVVPANRLSPVERSHRFPGCRGPGQAGQRRCCPGRDARGPQVPVGGHQRFLGAG